MEERLREYRAGRRRRLLVENAKQKVVSVTGRVTAVTGRVASVTDWILDWFPTITFQPDNMEPAEEKILIRSDSKETITSVDLTSELSEESVDIKAESWKFFILKWSLYTIIWLTMLAFFVKMEFGAVFIVISMLVGICLNTRTKPRKKGEVSAYSVFNKGCESIDGTLTAQQFEREIMYGPGAVR